jgi:hypothetical protein
MIVKGLHCEDLCASTVKRPRVVNINYLITQKQNYIQKIIMHPAQSRPRWRGKYFEWMEGLLGNPASKKNPDLPMPFKP